MGPLKNDIPPEPIDIKNHCDVIMEYPIFDKYFYLSIILGLFVFTLGVRFALSNLDHMK